MFRNLRTVRIDKDIIQANNPFKPVAIDRAADIILRSTEKRKFMVVFPLYAKILWWAHRVFPDLVEGIFVRKMNRLGRSGNL
jgi:hypothetical protein